MSSSKQKVGFVGAGLMGHGMAKNLMLKGYPLTVIDNRNRAPIDDLVERGAAEAKSMAELATASEIVILCVSNSDVVEEVLFESDFLANANPGTIVIDCTTSYPDRTREVETRLAEHGHRFCDSPLLRTPDHAERGELTSLISCDDELFAKVEPILDTFCTRVVKVGDKVGTAHEVKLINNFVSLTYIACWSEAFNTCMARGIDPATLHDVLSTGGLNCPNFQNYAKFVLDANEDMHKFSITNSEKDISYYQRLAQSVNASTLTADPVSHLLRSAVARGHGDDYATILPKIVGEMNGTPAGDLPRQKRD